VGLAGAIREQVQGYAANRKQDAVRAVSDVAAAIRESGASFGGSPHLKAFFDSAATGVEELSEDIGRRTVGELYDEVEAAVRRRPGIALAAAAVAGIALVRFFKASTIRPIPRSHAVVPVDVLPVPDIERRS
jgi:hypothetical protein